MKSKSIMRKVITGILAATLAVSASVVAMADSTSSVKTLNKTHSMQFRKGFGAGPQSSTKNFKSTLDSLVKAGTITQDQEDKITAYINQKDADRKAEMDKIKGMTADERKAYFEANKGKAKTDMLSDLVSQSIITQDQADAIKKAMPSPQGKPSFNKGKGFNFNTQLTSLVSAGTITQDQADKITAYMKQKSADMKAEMDKIKGMTADERKAYFEANKGKTKTDMFSDLVSQSIITQAQADAIKKTMPYSQGKPSFNKGKGFNFNTQLSSLVSAGTITQDTADKITAYMKQKADEMKAEMDKIKGMTADERKAYFEANKGKEKTDMLTDLVNQGIITQDVANTLKKALPQFNASNRHGMRLNGSKANAGTQIQSDTSTQAAE